MNNKVRAPCYRTQLWVISSSTEKQKKLSSRVQKQWFKLCENKYAFFHPEAIIIQSCSVANVEKKQIIYLCLLFAEEEEQIQKTLRRGLIFTNAALLVCLNILNAWTSLQWWDVVALLCWWAFCWHRFGPICLLRETGHFKSIQSDKMTMPHP